MSKWIILGRKDSFFSTKIWTLRTGSVALSAGRAEDLSLIQRSLDSNRLFQRLRPLIGRTCWYADRPCRLVEILAEEGWLVLEVEESLPPIQRDLYGRPSFRAPEILHVPILNQDGTNYSEELLTLLAALHPKKG